jgi:hypothetical protein
MIAPIQHPFLHILFLAEISGQKLHTQRIS